MKMTINNCTTEDSMNTISLYVNKLQSGKFTVQDVFELSGAVESAFQKYIDDVKNLHPQLCHDGNDISANRLLPYLCSYIVVSALVSLFETATRPFKEFLTNAAETEHNNRFKRIEDSIADIKTSYNDAKVRAEELGKILVRMSLPTNNSFEADEVEFDLQYKNLTIELELCVTKTNLVNDELKKGNLSIERYRKQSGTNFVHNAVVTGVLAVIGVLLLYTEIVGCSLWNIGIIFVPVLLILMGTTYKRSAEAKYYLYAKNKYDDYQQKLPPLKAEYEALIKKMDYLDEHIKDITSRRKAQELKDERMKEENLKRESSNTESLHDEIKNLRNAVSSLEVQVKNKKTCIIL